MFNSSREPAAYAEAVRLVAAALVGLGWLTIDSNTINAIVTAVGAVASVVLTVAVRAHVVPVTVQPPPVLPEPPAPPVSPVD